MSLIISLIKATLRHPVSEIGKSDLRIYMHCLSKNLEKVLRTLFTTTSPKKILLLNKKPLKKQVLGILQLSINQCLN